MSSQCSGSCGSCSSCSSCGEDKLGKKMALIKRKIFVLSGKGGVGKSSVAAALALKLAASGRKVGLLDADFHGPSQPTIFGAGNQKLGYSETDGIVPLPVAGVSLLSVGLLLDDPDQAVVWRGPAKMGVLKQLLEDTCWGELDDLILDFPPGTGDEILSAIHCRGSEILTRSHLSIGSDSDHRNELAICGNVLGNLCYLTRHTCVNGG